jgi:hypothetical protein
LCVQEGFSSFSKIGEEERKLLEEQIVKYDGEYHLVMGKGDIDIMFLGGLYGDEGKPYHSIKKNQMRIRDNIALVNESHCTPDGRGEKYW